MIATARVWRVVLFTTMLHVGISDGAHAQTLPVESPYLNGIHESDRNPQGFANHLTQERATLLATNPLPMPRPLLSGELANGGFEGTVQANGVGTGWSPFASSGYGATYAVVADVVHGGAKAQRVSSQPTQSDQYAGAYQTVSTTAGTSYSVRAWNRVSLPGGSGWPLVGRLGIDLTGGTIYTAPSVTWYEFSAPENGVGNWVYLERSVTATGTQMTIFLESWRKWASMTSSQTWFDDVEVVQGGATAVPPSATPVPPTATRVPPTATTRPSSTPVPPTSTPIPPSRTPTALPVGSLVNGGFEDAVQSNGVGAGWSAFASSGYGATYAVVTDVVHGGSKAQRVNSQPTGDDQYAGVYQTVATTAGMGYMVRAWNRVNLPGGSGWPLVGRLGIDLTGGTTYTAPSVTWYEFSAPENGVGSWQFLERSVTATGTRMTIFLESWRKWAGGGGSQTWFDDVEALAGGATATPIPATATSKPPTAVPTSTTPTSIPPSPTSTSPSTPRPTVVPPPDCPAALDFAEIRRGLNQQGKDLAYVKIGFHVSGINTHSGLGHWEQCLNAAGVPFVLKVVDMEGTAMEAARFAASYGVADTIVYRKDGEDMSWRVPYPNPWPSPTPDPVQSAINHWNLHAATFSDNVDRSGNRIPDIDTYRDRIWVETINEPWRDITEWLAEFSLKTAQLANAAGYKYAAFSWSSGDPDADAWGGPKMLEFLDYASHNRDKVAIALHEYQQDSPTFKQSYPFRMGRFQNIYTVTDAQGWPRPTIIVTEFGYGESEIQGDFITNPENVPWAAGMYAHGEDAPGMPPFPQNYDHFMGATTYDFGNISWAIAAMETFALQHYYEVPLASNPPPSPSPLPPAATPTRTLTPMASSTAVPTSTTPTFTPLPSSTAVPTSRTPTSIPPSATSTSPSTPWPTVVPPADCPAALDFAAIRRGLNQQGKDLAYVKIGFHVNHNANGLGHWEQCLNAAGVPFVLKVVDMEGTAMEAARFAASYGVADTIVIRKDGPDMSWRVPYPNPWPSPTPDPVQAAINHWNLHVATFSDNVDRYGNRIPDIDTYRDRIWVETINEPWRDITEWLAEFSLKTAQLANAAGYKYAAFSWSSGDPDADAWAGPKMLEFLEYACLHRDKVAIALHEYVQDSPTFKQSYPFRIGRFQNIYNVTDAHGWPRPTIIVTEFGYGESEIQGDFITNPENVPWAAGMYAHGEDAPGMPPYPQNYDHFMGATTYDFGSITWALAAMETFALQHYYEVPLASNPPPSPSPLPPVATPTRTFTPLPSSTPLPPTLTPSRTPLPPTATPTRTFTPLPSATPLPPTLTPSRTPLPPTATPTRTFTPLPSSTPLPPTLTPSRTPLPPTATSSWTRTPLPSATSSQTPVPTSPPGSNVARSAIGWMASSVYGSAYGGDKAYDGVVSVASKWTSNGSTRESWLALDLGKAHIITGFVVRHAGYAGELKAYNTQAFRLETGDSLGGPWTVRASVDNTAQQDVTFTVLQTPVTARTVRLSVTDAGIDNYARIPEFEVFSIGSGTPPNCPTGQYLSEYFNGTSPGGPLLWSACETSVNYNWAAAGPGNGVPNDNFSVRWTGRFTFEAGEYAFIGRSDDGIRIWVDGVLVVDAWGDRSYGETRGTRTMTAGEHEVKVEYYEHLGSAAVQVLWEKGTLCASGQFHAEYFNNITLSGAPVFAQCENAINYNWAAGGPGNGVPNDNFSVRWAGRFAFEAGEYAFIGRSDDGIRIWVDGALAVDAWRDRSYGETRGTRTMTAGDHEVEVEYYEHLGSAAIQVLWEKGNGPALSTGWEDGQPLGYSNRIEYVRSVVGYYNSSNPPPEASRVTQEAVPMAPNGGTYYLRVAGYSQASYAYAYFRLFDTNIPIQTGMKLGFWVYPQQRSTFAIDGHFTDGNTMRDLYNGDFLKDLNGVRIHPGLRGVYAAGQWHYIEVDLSRAAGKTLDYLMVAFDNGSDGYIGPIRAYFDNVSIGR